jgi:hypothetical protein
MSAATIAKMRASQQARWANKNGASAVPVAKAGKRTMSPEARDKIAAAQRARWAMSEGTSTTPVAIPAKKKGGLSTEGRARIVAAQKARHAAAKKGTPSVAVANAKAKVTGKPWYSK